MASSNHSKFSVSPTRVLSGKDKAEILDRKVADLKRRTKIKRQRSFEETRARDSQSRLNKIYAKFHRPTKKMLSPSKTKEIQEDIPLADGEDSSQQVPSSLPSSLPPQIPKDQDELIVSSSSNSITSANTSGDSVNTIIVSSTQRVKVKDATKHRSSSRRHAKSSSSKTPQTPKTSKTSKISEVAQPSSHKSVLSTPSHSPRLKLSISAATSSLSSIFSPISSHKLLSSPLKLTPTRKRNSIGSPSLSTGDNSFPDELSTPKRVAFSSDLESSPIRSSPIKGAPEPKSILKNLEEEDDMPRSNTTIEVLRKDLRKEESWPSGFVLQLLPGSLAISKVVEGSVAALSDPDFSKKYEVFATLNDIIKVNNRELTKSMFEPSQLQTIVKAIDTDLANTGRELKSGSNAFRIRTSIQALKLLTFIMTYHQIRGASAMLKRVSTMFLSENLSKGLAAALLQLMKDQQNNISPSAVEHVISAILQMKYFMSTTIITEKLMAIRRFIAVHPAVMSKISYQWMSHILCCIINTEVPSYERIVNACIYVLYEFSRNSESKDVVYQLLNETLNENSSSIKASTLDSVTPDTKIVDALTLTLVYMINRGWSAQALDIWAYMTFMIGYKFTNQVDLESWSGLRHWIKVFDEALKNESENVKLAALSSWRAIIYNYQISKTFAAASLKRDDLDRKRSIFLYPFTVISDKAPVSDKLIEGYVVLYYRLLRFLRTLCISPGAKKVVDPEWVLNCVFSPFYSVFIKRPEFFSAGLKLLEGVLQFSERPTIKSMETPEICFRKINPVESWTLSCLPKQLILSYYNKYYDIVSFVLLNEQINIDSKVEVFNSLLSTLDECTKNAIVSFEAVNGFLRVSDTYLRQMMIATTENHMAKPDIQYLSNIILQARSIFGLKILTGQTVSMNLLALVGSFVFNWYGPTGIHNLIQALYPALSKKYASIFFGLVLLRDDDVNKTLIDELSEPNLSLPVFLTDLDTWNDVILRLSLNKTHFKVIVEKIVDYEAKQKSNVKYKDIAKVLNSFVSIDEKGLSQDSAAFLLSQYALNLSDDEETSFAPVVGVFETFIKNAQISEVVSLVQDLPPNKCPVDWYMKLSDAFANQQPNQIGIVIEWIKRSEEFLRRKYPKRCEEVLGRFKTSEADGANLLKELKEVIDVEQPENSINPLMNSLPLSAESSPESHMRILQLDDVQKDELQSDKSADDSLPELQHTETVEIIDDDDVIDVLDARESDSPSASTEKTSSPEFQDARLPDIGKEELNMAITNPSPTPGSHLVFSDDPQTTPTPQKRKAEIQKQSVKKIKITSSESTVASVIPPLPTAAAVVAPATTSTFSGFPGFPTSKDPRSPYPYPCFIPCLIPMPMVPQGDSTDKPEVFQLETVLSKLLANPAQLGGMDAQRKKVLEDSLLGVLMKMRGM
ncbi:hypothetical protein FOA43_002770 [Brettanomyces nanus]|uniref:Telomere-associated protein Rif1 N-terminal domain-containing protein n=1 Tax=Eeniella nana TaxID=13502 RepID=A0A875S244_EENNA|nr:uncharacterized protein FOA43_002770 [Brettanomyces nanus]QPG75416.1 hypothetical protein FOA43_002770 [Brettanomyces nanus]